MSDVYEEAIKDGNIYHSVTLTKNTKGYSWEVKTAGMDKEKVRETAVELEKFFKDKYGDAN
jgi:hypothetical protein